jgi:hypothetical protein
MVKRPKQFGEGSVPNSGIEAPRRYEGPRQYSENIDSTVDTTPPQQLPRVVLTEANIDRIEGLSSQYNLAPNSLVNQALDALGVETVDEIPNQSPPSPSSFKSSQTPSSTIVRNRAYVIRTSTAIITSLQEVLEYDPIRNHNQQPPELWLNDQKYISEIRELVAELKTLNKLLQTKVAPEKEHNAIVDLGVHANKFLDSFASVTGKGAGWLLVAALASLLYQTGIVPDIAASLFQHIKIPV